MNLQSIGDFNWFIRVQYGANGSYGLNHVGTRSCELWLHTKQHNNYYYIGTERVHAHCKLHTFAQSLTPNRVVKAASTASVDGLGDRSAWGKMPKKQNKNMAHKFKCMCAHLTVLWQTLVNDANEPRWLGRAMNQWWTAKCADDTTESSGKQCWPVDSANQTSVTQSMVDQNCATH